MPLILQPEKRTCMILASLTSILVAVALPQADTLAESVVVSSVKRQLTDGNMTAPVTSLTLKQIESESIGAPKALSGRIPGLTIPDYGSSMTSTIYIRGIGSRMENPVMGLYVDDVPVIDKNSFDFSFLDIRRVDMMRGPQGTLYGRNAMLGVMSVETLSPASWQGCRASVEYGSASSLNVKASAYHGNVGVAAMYRHSGGFYTNEYTGRNCDVSDAGAFRLRWTGRLKRADADNVFSASYTDEGGYPYRLWTAGKLSGDSGEAMSGGWLEPVSYNDKCAYRRLSVMDGLRVNVPLHMVELNSVTSVQVLADKMTLDQDFTPLSMFTLQQRQRQGVVTQELILKPSSHPAWWDWQTGFFVFGKYNAMHAPVTFLPDGIRTLILDNANAYIPEEFGKLSFKEESFPIASDFGLWSYNVAAYHESYFSFGRWNFSVGLRLDHEGDFMAYDSESEVHFKLSAMPDYLSLSTVYEGNEHEFFFQVLPKASASFDATSRSMQKKRIALSFNASVSRGYRSGGFNTQIFSDILQNRMMDGMMSRLGVYMDSEGELPASSTTYKPESCTDYEIGGRFSSHGGQHLLDLSATAYYVDCRNQQITVFPYDKGTGRMMSNAGKSRSAGVEAELQWRWKGLNVNASASWNDARFVSYDDGREDWSGNRIPYSPASSLFFRASYRFPLDTRMMNAVSLAADVSRAGTVVWNEAGDIIQPPYVLLGADVRFSFRKVEFFLRGENLSGTAYRTFYFKSVGNSFFQTGKPRRFNAGVSMEF